MSHRRKTVVRLCTLSFVAAAFSGCTQGSSDTTTLAQPGQVETCMSCHNGAQHNDYSGPGLENPHPFPGAGTLKCTECHGGDGHGSGQSGSHVPPPPEIGDREKQDRDARAYFNRLTLAGVDKFSDYTANGSTYSPIDWLQFVNPGDLRVVTQGRGCGQCHAGHADCVAKSLLATEAGILSGAMFSVGVPNQVPENAGLYGDTAADLAFRAVSDPGFVPGPDKIGAVGRLMEFPVYSVRGANGPLDIYENQLYTALNLPSSLQADNTVAPNSPLANLYHEQVAFTCGDCHLGSAGANNRYGDFRSSGCTSCHMRYALDGRSRSTDPNINKVEPLDPDDIDDPERPHVRRHVLASVAKTLPSGEFVEGIDDYTCAGCHQGSNRTVMQYWGIRLDQNADVRRRRQYPSDPFRHQTTHGDTRLFDPVVGNRTFNGRNANQYLLFEDYDGDDRDDTPPDVHYEAGMGCIDCHGSYDLHGGRIENPPTASIMSHQEQAVAIRCESCHGGIESYAATRTGFRYDGTQAEMAVDAAGNVLKHVIREADGEYYLYSRLTGKRHYVPQTRDTVDDNGKLHPFTGQPIYNAKASYAMGRVDLDPTNGMGPEQTTGGTSGFSHTDNMSCVSCHASWTNNCVGCHLGGEYNRGNNFSNITGERIVFRQADADFVYQSPVLFQLGVDAHNRIAPISPNTETFFRYRDLNGDLSQVFAFSDRRGSGNNPNTPATGGTGPYPALSHNVMMPHSIRGRVTADKEGPRYCAACHLTDRALADFGTEYDTFRLAMETNDFAALDFDLLREHIGENPGNQLNSPLWVHMVAGLGSGLFLFDQEGCPVNPLDDDANRFGCDGVAPSDRFDLNNVVYNLDRLVESSGVSNGSSNHMIMTSGGPNHREGALDQDMSGPLGRILIERLTDPNTGIVLDSWIDADGQPRGGAVAILGTP